MAGNPFSGKYGIIILAVFLGVIGSILQDYFPDLTMKIAGMVIEPLNTVMALMVFSVFAFYVMNEEQSAKEIVGQLFPIILIGGIIGTYFGLGIEWIILYVILMMFSPLAGRLIRGLARSLLAKKGKRLKEVRDTYLEEPSEEEERAPLWGGGSRGYTPPAAAINDLNNVVREMAEKVGIWTLDQRNVDKKNDAVAALNSAEASFKSLKALRLINDSEAEDLKDLFDDTKKQLEPGATAA